MAYGATCNGPRCFKVIYGDNRQDAQSKMVQVTHPSGSTPISVVFCSWRCGRLYMVALEKQDAKSRARCGD